MIVHIVAYLEDNAVESVWETEAEARRYIEAVHAATVVRRAELGITDPYPESLYYMDAFTVFSDTKESSDGN